MNNELWLSYADESACATPNWIGKGLTCVCFKRKGAYERLSVNLTPVQVRKLIPDDTNIEKRHAIFFLS